MAEHGHLELVRVDLERPRRKRPGFGTGGRVPNVRQHGQAIHQAVEEAERRTEQARVDFPGIDPARVLVFELQASVEDERWADYGVTLVEKDRDRIIGLFRDTEAKRRFEARLAAFTEERRSRRPGQIRPDDYAFFAAIREAHPPSRQDRIGPRLAGVNLPEIPSRGFDVELWHPGDRGQCSAKTQGLERWLRADGTGGRVSDAFIGDSLFIIRVISSGAVIDRLLELPDVRRIDLPPSPDVTHGGAYQARLPDFPPTPSPPNDAPAIVIIDSGIRSGHPFLAPAIGEAAYFLTGSADSDDVTPSGHGTKVAGLALYGDVDACLRAGVFTPTLRLYSGRVLNSENEFDDEKLIVDQMREAITYFKENYGCRVFNVSLGARIAHSERKATPWAWILDYLAREMDVVVVVSAGNYRYIPGGDSPDTVVTQYPNFLLTGEARIGEPAIGAITITVGSLAERDNVPQGPRGIDPAFRLIAGRGEPSPFTRSGPGLSDAIKPEVCEFGGGWVYDGRLRQAIPADEFVGVLSLNRNFAGGPLFAADSGTSFAAPRVAHLAARLVSEYPAAPANLIRALIANSARHTAEARDRFAGNLDGLVRLCGYGRPSIARALFSDDHRATLYAVGLIPLDAFHLYRVPIPDEFRERRGERRIVVTLASDPPTRHTRYDYLGCSMAFRLLRGYPIEQIRRAFEPRDQVRNPLDALQEVNTHDLSPTRREGGTLQQAVFTFQRAISDDYGDEYFLLVRCQDEWVNKDRNPAFRQRYAVVVTLEHDDPQAQIYAQARIRARAERLRLRRSP